MQIDIWESKENADTLVAKTAKSGAEDSSIVLYQKTNVLVILLHHCNLKTETSAEKGKKHQREIRRHTQQKTTQLRLVWEEKKQS